MVTLFVQHLTGGAENDTLNRVELTGALCKPPVYRSTPFGREICDLMLAVNRAFGKSDYIPCIAWGRNAQFASRFHVGDRLRVTGRLQSREYQKLLKQRRIHHPQRLRGELLYARGRIGRPARRARAAGRGAAALPRGAASPRARGSAGGSHPAEHRIIKQNRPRPLSLEGAAGIFALKGRREPTERAAALRGAGFARHCPRCRGAAFVCHYRIVNCGPAKGCVWPVAAPAEAFVRPGAGLRGVGGSAAAFMFGSRLLFAA